MAQKGADFPQAHNYSKKKKKTGSDRKASEGPLYPTKMTLPLSSTGILDLGCQGVRKNIHW